MNKLPTTAGTAVVRLLFARMGRAFLIPAIPYSYGEMVGILVLPVCFDEFVLARIQREGWIAMSRYGDVWQIGTAPHRARFLSGLGCQCGHGGHSYISSFEPAMTMYCPVLKSSSCSIASTFLVDRAGLASVAEGGNASGSQVELSLSVGQPTNPEKLSYQIPPDGINLPWHSSQTKI